MSRRGHTIPGRFREERLAAYHDGELSGFARWRFERRLRGSPELRRELEALSELGGWIRESHTAAPGPDVWDAIAPRLAAADARRARPAPASFAQRAEGERRPVEGRWRGLRWLAWPGAAAATAALAMAYALGWLEPEKSGSGGVVRWVESRGRDVMVLEEGPDTTIIWVFDGPAERGGLGGGRDAV